MRRSEAARLLAPAALLLGACGLAAALVHWTGEAAAEARKRQEQAAVLLAQAEARLARVDEERRMIERYAPAYLRLLDAGIVGAERRVDWIDALRRASQALRGFGADYRLGAQQPAAPRAGPGGVAVRESEMTVNLRLLHEGDLLAFLQALEAQGAGLLLPAGCTVERLASGPFAARFEPKLAAECRLFWLTLEESPAKEEP